MKFEGGGAFAWGAVWAWPQSGFQSPCPQEAAQGVMPRSRAGARRAPKVRQLEELSGMSVGTIPYPAVHTRTNSKS